MHPVDQEQPPEAGVAGWQLSVTEDGYFYIDCDASEGVGSPMQLPSDAGQQTQEATLAPKEEFISQPPVAALQFPVAAPTANPPDELLRQLRSLSLTSVK